VLFSKRTPAISATAAICFGDSSYVTVPGAPKNLKFAMFNPIIDEQFDASPMVSNFNLKNTAYTPNTWTAEAMTKFPNYSVLSDGIANSTTSGDYPSIIEYKSVPDFNAQVKNLWSWQMNDTGLGLYTFLAAGSDTLMEADLESGVYPTVGQENYVDTKGRNYFGYIYDLSSMGKQKVIMTNFWSKNTTATKSSSTEKSYSVEALAQVCFFMPFKKNILFFSKYKRKNCLRLTMPDVVT